MTKNLYDNSDWLLYVASNLIIESKKRNIENHGFYEKEDWLFLSLVISLSQPFYYKSLKNYVPISKNNNLITNPTHSDVGDNCLA